MMKDKVLRAFVANGDAVLYAVSSTELVEKARLTHNLSPLATAALGRLLSGALLMAQTLKDENESLSVTVNGSGPIGNLVVVVHGFNTVKGYVDHPYTDLPLKANGKLDVGRAVGKDGFITVIKSMGMKEPYVGRTELVSGEIAEDISNYYAMSEQNPNAVALGVKVDTDRSVIASGGVGIMPLPGCPEEVIDRFEEKMRSLSNLSSVLSKYDSLEAMIEGEFADLGGYTILKSDSPVFACDCSVEKLGSVLLSLGRTDVEEILAEQGDVQLTCHFCNRNYVFHDYDIRQLFDAQEQHD